MMGVTANRDRPHESADDRTLRIHNLSWAPEKTRAPILDQVTCSFENGFFYGIIGPNGSGKTSLIRHILRFLDVPQGTVTLDGKNIEEYRRVDLAREIAFVPQNTQIEVPFSVYDIVMMGRTPYQNRFGGTSETDRDAVQYAMDLTDCAYLKDQEFTLLSGGEAQRVIAARAIAQDTPWLILDEPISNLDIRHQLGIMDTLKMLNQTRGRTIISVLHDVNLASAYCDRLILMKDGRIFAEGPTGDTLTLDNLRSVYGMEFSVILHPETGKKYFVPNQFA